MELVPLAETVLVYDDLETIELHPGAQHYGHLHGTFEGERLAGTVRVTNLAPGRPDDVNQPTLRGVLRTHDDVLVWLEADGYAVLREEDQSRLAVSAVRFRTGDERYAWLNTVLAVLDARLDSRTGEARGRLYECRPGFAVGS